MVQYYNNTLTVSAAWLIDNGIVSKSNYDALNRRKKIQVVRRGCKNTPAEVAYDSMPEHLKRSAAEVMGGNPYDKVRVNQVETHIVHNEATSMIFEDYLLADGRHLLKETRREYYANAIVLDAIHALIADKKAYRAARGKGTTANKWNWIADGVQELDRTRYPHALPANPRRLEDRYKKYRKEGPTSLIHKNFLNKNAGSVAGDEVKESMLMLLLSDHRNLDNAQVAQLYNTVAEPLGWKKITAGAVAVWRDKFETDIYARRRGETAFRNHKTMQVKRSAPTRPLYYLTMDGWSVELLYRQQTTNKKTGYSTTTYHNRATVVVVLDPCVKYPIGFAVGTHESPDLIKSALRNAARHSKELFGAMYRAHQLQSDRYAIGSLTPYYEVMGDKFTPAQAKNAKAKVIEPYFLHLNKTYCQMEANWSGFGITSNKDKQANGDFLNAIKKSFPDFEGVCRQISEIIEKERAAKRAAYLELWEKTEAEDKLLLSHEQYLLHFGETSGNRILMQSNGLKPTILGQKRDYDCFDLTFRDHYSTRWEVRYDPEDLSHVLAVNEDETRRYTLEEKYVQPMALKDRKEGDSDQLQRVRDYNKRLGEKVAANICEAQDNVQELMSVLPQLGTLGKLLITDSNGQHKNRKSALPPGGAAEEKPKRLKKAEPVEEGLNIYNMY